MARPDRLMRLMDALRRLPAPVTAVRLAAETDISPRQLYRDIATLRAGGALIDGEAGVGYRLTEDPALPPQSFSRLEIEALVLAVGELRQTGDAALEAAGRSALARIIATLADGQSRHAMHTILRSFRPPPAAVDVGVDMSLLRRACWEELALDVRYRDLGGRVTQREVWPLGISYSDGALKLLVWCCLRQDWRVFRASGIEEARLNGRGFRPRRVPLLRDYAARQTRPEGAAEA
ncbi:helix-turn-helix transcriptional regulator [Limimaricola hongkongensis]|uniref:Transcriptional regulator, DeoR family n=1 Tax=Limimaricola hongkongensis DSM 17492 TaxID=1122180 RepID=A0A017HBL9_9RHOB|nr:WYL domain-containing protein [Limimaricola hongkongensis]EYD71705.1 Transcriptional regulator, DeoR family [Limimaricola hongkongensis DSM 17492]